MLFRLNERKCLIFDLQMFGRERRCSAQKKVFAKRH